MKTGWIILVGISIVLIVVTGGYFWQQQAQIQKQQAAQKAVLLSQENFWGKLLDELKDFQGDVIILPNNKQGLANLKTKAELASQALLELRGDIYRKHPTGAEALVTAVERAIQYFETVTKYARSSVTLETMAGIQKAMAQTFSDYRIAMKSNTALNEADLYSTRDKIINIVAGAKKEALPPERPRDQIVYVRPGVFYEPTAPLISSYFVEMRGLVSRYNRARLDLNRYIQVAKRYGYVYQTGYGSYFDNAYTERQAILARAESMNPPLSYSGVHDYFIDMVRYALTAMDDLRDGDYPTFKAKSDVISRRFRTVKATFGIR